MGKGEFKKMIVVLIGESAVGKTTTIKALQKSDERITPIPLITDRAKRLHEEEDRLCVSVNKFRQMEKDNLLIPIVYKHGNKYSVEKKLIQQSLNENNIPIFDYTYEGVLALDEFRNILFPIYLKPVSLPVLQKRLQNLGRDPNGKRFKAAKKEIKKMESLNFSPEVIVGGVVINNDIATTTSQILEKIYSKL